MVEAERDLGRRLFGSRATTPKALRIIARGCGAAATLGSQPVAISSTPKGLRNTLKGIFRDPVGVENVGWGRGPLGVL